MDNNEVLLSVSSITFNHSPYIKECLDGFLMQKTNFNFEILIHDDASTDGTGDIIRSYAEKYPHIIKPIIQIENQYSKGNRNITQNFNVPRVRGKYIAFCEGDDYWIDPNKLQMQVDFLEQNPDYGMVYTQAKVFNQAKGRFLLQKRGKPFGGFDDLIAQGLYVQPMTVCLRFETYLKYLKEMSGKLDEWVMGDYPMVLWFSLFSKVHFIKKTTGVYRLLQNSACHSSNIEKQLMFYRNAYDVKKFFVEKYRNKKLPEFNENKEKALLLARSVKNERKEVYNLLVDQNGLNLKFELLRITSKNSFLYIFMRIYMMFKHGLVKYER